MKTEIVSARLPTDLIEQLKKLAAKYNMTLSTLLRITFLHETDKYLSNLCFVDNEKADEIKKAVCDLLNISQDMTVQIKRIGTNYNQIAHALNSLAKTDNRGNISTVNNNSKGTGFQRTSAFALKQQFQHEELNKNERKELEKAATDLISDSTLSDLIGTYTAAAKSMQDALADIYKAVM